MKKYRKKAGSVGFDWEETEPIYDKIAEETAEVKEAVKNGNADEIEEEYGDLLFAVVNLGRHLKVTPEIALTKASDKFVNRFKENGRKMQFRTVRIWQNFRQKSLMNYGNL